MDTQAVITTRRITAEEYSDLFDARANCFATTRFALLNQAKADAVHFVAIGREGRAPIAGIIFGEKDGVLKAPFSAPFAELTFRASEPPLFTTLMAVADAIGCYGAGLQMDLRITLPPVIYSPTTSAKTEKAFTCAGFTASVTDLNFHLDLTDAPCYGSTLRHNGRKNLATALKSGLTFVTDADIERAYRVIQANRSHRGWPLRMTLEQVVATSAVVPVECFVVTTPDGRDAAAAVVYHVAPCICQVVYWGDAPGFGNLRPVNFLAAQLVSHYASRGITTLDIGPSTEDGIPNQGLCDFKESIGCLTSIKTTLYKPYTL